MFSVESSSPFFLPSPFSSYPTNKTRLWKPAPRSHFTSLQCHKMFVPGFGEASPEAKAAKHLHDFFTYVAVKIVTSQLQVSNIYALPPISEQRSSPTMPRLVNNKSYNKEAYADLMQFVDHHSLEDGDKFCAELMRESSRHKSLALRILEVRSAYCKNDFEWDNMKKLASKMVNDQNARLMRDYVSETSSMNNE